MQWKTVFSWLPPARYLTASHPCLHPPLHDLTQAAHTMRSCSSASVTWRGWTLCTSTAWHGSFRFMCAPSRCVRGRIDAVLDCMNYWIHTAHLVYLRSMAVCFFVDVGMRASQVGRVGDRSLMKEQHFAASSRREQHFNTSLQLTPGPLAHFRHRKSQTNCLSVCSTSTATSPMRCT